MGKQQGGHNNEQERDHLRKQAWQLWCRGVRNISEISRQLGISWDTTKKYIDHKRKETKDRIEAGDEIAEILSGYQETIAAAWSIYASADNDNAKVGALGKVQEGLKAVAGMFDISTSASRQEVKVDGSSTVIAALGDNPEGVRLLSELAGQLASRPVQPGDTPAQPE